MEEYDSETRRGTQMHVHTFTKLWQQLWNIVVMYLGHSIMLFFVIVHFQTSHTSNDLFRFTRCDRTWQNV